MRSSTLRWLVLLATFLITLIIGVQLFWLNKVYSFEQRTFTTNVVKSIRGLYEDLNITDTISTHLQELIEHPAPDYFLFRINTDERFKDSIAYYLKHELNDFDVLTDSYIGFYSKTEAKYTDEEYMSTAASRYRKEENLDLPEYKRPYDYVLIYFPHRNKYVLSQ